MDFNPKTCELMGGFGLLIQLLLAILCFTALVIKRFFEDSPRPWIIWLLVC